MNEQELKEYLTKEENHIPKFVTGGLLFCSQKNALDFIKYLCSHQKSKFFGCDCSDTGYF